MLHGPNGCAWEPPLYHPPMHVGPLWRGGGQGDAWDADPARLERTHIIKALQGAWVNVDSLGERYVVVGQHVTRMDAQGSRHFTLQWDQRRKQLQWGTHGRLHLMWQGDSMVAWIPSRHHARAWRWQRAPPPPPASPALMPPMWCPPPCPSTSLGHAMTADSVISSYGPWRRPYVGHRARAQPYVGHQPRVVAHAYAGDGGTEPRLPCGLSPSEVFDLLFREITPDDYETLLRLDETVSRPIASAASIESLPTACARDLLGEECAVCLAAFESQDLVATLPCRHHFHRSCIAKWLSECRRSCPLCGNDALPS